MRTAKMTIGSETYDLCFSLRVAGACEERYGSLEGIAPALSGEGKSSMEVLRECLWLLAQMLEAGRRWAEHEKLPAPEPPSEDDLLDLWGLDDIPSLKDQVFSTISLSNHREVEARPAKNGEAAGAPAARSN